MAPPSRDQIESMAFMAMMDGIIHTSVPCDCPSCKTDGKSKSATRFEKLKRAEADLNEKFKQASKIEHSTTCSHNHSAPELKPYQSARRSAQSSSTNKSSTTTTANSGRLDKINTLLKADSVQSIFDVLNLTATSREEKDLATKIQNATKDCKLYQETKDKIVELCDDEDSDLDAVFGLLAKFRHERNLLATTVIKGNNEREKALLCIQRVDHLMYMLHDVAKQKDSKSGDVMHKLGDIIVEIHDLAKSPSVLYDEFLDIKEEHFDLLHDHEEMRQKFIDVNSCHERLHTSHDKLQTEHSKLLKDHSETKKKAGGMGGLKNDISRLEKAVDKNISENSELKKEVERLNSELAKVNALKHENVQLKKKIATLSAPPILVDAIAKSPLPQSSKKKKGKKVNDEAAPLKQESPNTVKETEIENKRLEEVYNEQVAKLRQSHEVDRKELTRIRGDLNELQNLARKAENSRDQALEKLEVERATSRNWKDIATKHGGDRDRLKAELDRHVTKTSKLQSSIKELEQTLDNTKCNLAERTEAHRQVKEELDQRAATPAISMTSTSATFLGPDAIRLLRKIKSETSQLTRDLEDSKCSAIDMFSLLDMVQFAVRRVVFEVERDIEEILSVRGNDLPINGDQNATSHHVPETVVPFTHNGLPSRHTPQLNHHFDYDPHPHGSPHITPSVSLPPFRPMMPPPGLSDTSPISPFGHHQPTQLPHHHHSTALYNRNRDSPSLAFSRLTESSGLMSSNGFHRPIEPQLAMSATGSRKMGPIGPPSTSSMSSTSGHLQNGTPDVGVIGSRIPSSKLNSTAGYSINASSSSPASTPGPATTITTATPSLSSTTNQTPSPAPRSTPMAPAVPTTITATATATTTATAPPGGLGNGAAGVDWNMWARGGK